MAVDHEGGVGLAIGGSFMLVSYCPGFDGCFGELDQLEAVTVAGISSPPKGSAVPEELSIDATEIWALESDDQGLNKSSEIDSE